jgi:hypothetical protein
VAFGAHRLAKRCASLKTIDMRTSKIFTTILTLMLSSQILLAEEITLFNSDGEAIAYIDAEDEDLTIYMWNGTPVAYLDPDGDDFNIYGFNGEHLGWFEDGIIRDHEGYAVGFIEGATNVYTKYEPYKSHKKYKPYQSYKKYAPYKPYNKNQFSNESLSLFLMKGKK